METRQLILGLCLAVAVYLIYAQLYSAFAPKPRPPGSATETIETVPAAGGPADSPARAGESRDAALLLAFSSGATTEPIRLGGEEGDMLEVVLSPVGASVETIRLTERDPKKRRYRYRASADSQDPVCLISPVADAEQVYRSFGTARLRIEGRGAGWPLTHLVWQVSEAGPQRAVFTTTLTPTDGSAGLLRVDKTYALEPGRPVLRLALDVTNLSGEPLTVELVQDGPVGILREHVQYDMRRLGAAWHDARGELVFSNSVQWKALRDAMLSGEPLKLFSPQQGHVLQWVALGDKFFAIYTRPLPGDDPRGGFVSTVTGHVALPHRQTPNGDLLARLTTRPRLIPPQADRPARYEFEIYAGPKDADILRRVNPAYASRALGYQHFQEMSCFCVPMWLTDLMTGLLQAIQAVVINGGLAIIVLVLIVRLLLHPLSVFQQKSMYRMQESMARIQPKIAAIEERFPNDKVRQNQEKMKLFAEEGVNPAAGLVGMLPLMIQIPILGALWTAMNTDIHLRHAPLDGWWIRDLSAPDALIPFHPPIDIPVLSWIPLIGPMFTQVSAFNLLPVLMGVSMWLQQKYMPKPHVQAQQEAARRQPTEPRPQRGGMTPEEQLRQQRIMAYMMSIMFPFMFYYMPAGLNLYWMATNVVGIAESLIIRRQLQAEKKRRESPGYQPPPRRPGLMARLFRRLAEQAEELQKKADQLSEHGRAPGRREADRKRG
jgi:YidC/Oxa1 family membrane protein insertase